VCGVDTLIGAAGVNWGGGRPTVGMPRGAKVIRDERRRRWRAGLCVEPACRGRCSHPRQSFNMAAKRFWLHGVY
jgi:hypothetical protein